MTANHIFTPSNRLHSKKKKNQQQYLPVFVSVIDLPYLTYRETELSITFLRARGDDGNPPCTFFQFNLRYFAE